MWIDIPYIESLGIETTNSVWETTHPARENRREPSRLKISPKLTAILPLKSAGGYMSCPLPTAARTQEASKRVVAQRDARSCWCPMTRVAVGVAPGSCCRLSGPNAFDNANLGTVEFRKEVSCPVVGKRCICPRAKWENFEPWDSKKFHRGVRKNSLRSSYTLVDRLFTLHFSMA